MAPRNRREYAAELDRQEEPLLKRMRRSMSVGLSYLIPSSRDRLSTTSTSIAGVRVYRSRTRDGQARNRSDGPLALFNPQVGTEMADVFTPSSIASIEMHSMRTIDMTTSTKASAKNTVRTVTTSPSRYVGALRVDLHHAIGDNVAIDDGAITGVIMAISIEPGGISYKVEWLHNGCNQVAWFLPLRLRET